MKVLLFLHVLGVVLFLGNIVTAAFWKIVGERTKDLRTIYHAVRYVMIADYVFTIPGIALILITGHAMAHQAGYALFEISWLGISYMLFILVGILWGVVLLPAQMKMIRYAKKSLSTGSLDNDYWKSSRIWNGFGSLATIIPVIILILMSIKP